MSYRDVIIGSARAQLDNANANSQAIAWFRSVENAEVAYGYRGYHIQDNDKWCAVFVSWCAAQAGILNQIVPFECGTNEMYNIYSSVLTYSYLN